MNQGGYQSPVLMSDARKPFINETPRSYREPEPVNVPEPEPMPAYRPAQTYTQQPMIPPRRSGLASIEPEPEPEPVHQKPAFREPEQHTQPSGKQTHSYLEEEPEPTFDEPQPVERSARGSQPREQHELRASHNPREASEYADLSNAANDDDLDIPAFIRRKVE